jgi:hypothetical protein
MDYELLKKKVNNLVIKTLLANSNRPIEIVSGAARGADKLGERYAKEHDLPIKQFPADWNNYGKQAGYLRNKQMAEYATHCICFWDGISRGTELMIQLCEQHKVEHRVIMF